LSKEEKENGVGVDTRERTPEPREKIAEGDGAPDDAPDAGGGGEIDELSCLKDRLLRQAAEYDNYRKRTAKERLELSSEITAKIVAAFLPVMDGIERALQSECSDANYKKGIEMIYSGFLETLKSLGVEEITGEDFDPSVHQAVQNVESAELASGKIAQVFQKGYKIGGKIIRFAMVATVK
jgi:molecular chaperone GrpE